MHGWDRKKLHDNFLWFLYVLESSDTLDMIFWEEKGHDKPIFTGVKVSTINIFLTEVSSSGVYSFGV